MSVFKQVLVIAVLAGLACGAYYGYTTYFTQPETATADRPSRPVTIEVATTNRQVIANTVEAVGTTRAARSVAIVPEADGRIVELSISTGAKVNKGDVLVRLDDAIAQADLAEAKARLTEQEQALTRIEQLRSTNAVSQATLEEAIARLAEANAQLDRAGQRLRDRKVLAPFSGVLGLAEVDVGARVTTDDMITRLDDLNDVELEFSLPETLFAQVERGMPIKAQSVAFPGRIFDGVIEAVDTRIDPVSRAFRTRAVIPNKDGVLPAGMFMSLRLVLAEFDALTVPEEAIVFQAAETYVFLINDDTAQRKVVQTGQRQDGMIAIEAGLNEGDIVAIRGLQRLRDGASVRLKSQAPTTQSTTDGDT